MHRILTKHRVAQWLTTAALTIALPATACDLTVTTQMLESPNDVFVFSLLKLSLSKTDKDICFSHHGEILTDGRQTREVEKGVLSVKWEGASSSPSLELRPVPVPIYRGLLGHRIFVIRERDQKRFSSIRSIEDLKNMRAGQGLFWGDTKILRAAGLPVVTSAQARNLWAMLKAERFDYIPLGIHQPWAEVESRESYLMAVESSVLLSYPSGLFFYVSRTNTELLALITQGMQQAMSDGSYDQALMESDMLQKTKNAANIDHRHLIEIENPLISEELLISLNKYGIGANELKGYLSRRANNETAAP